MKKNFLYAACLLATMGCMVSCIDDDNNYNYSQVNMIQGGVNNFDNISYTYNVAVGQELTISPTFKYTIDKENPDVSFEWTMDGQKIEGANQQSHTFCFDKSGSHDVSFYVIDNKTGLKFGASTVIKVMAAYQRGWVILSKADDGRAILSFITPSSIKYTTTYKDKELIRDSLVYKSSVKDINQNLVKNPTGMFLNVGNADYNDSFGIEEYDEVVVKGDQWEELNGNTLEHETYTLEEFGGDAPASIKLAEAAYTYSMKAVRSEDGYIYCNVKTDAADFHIGNFTSIPINNSMKFKRLFQYYKYDGPYCNTILALSEDNSLMAIADAGKARTYTSESSINENSRRLSSNVYNITSEDDKSISLQKIKDDIIDLRPACGSSDFGYDFTRAYPFYVALTQDPVSKLYSLMSFKVSANYGNKSYAYVKDYQKRPFGLISDYKDMAVFPSKHYVVIADGNKLYYCQYGINSDSYTELLGERKLIKTFDHDIVSLDANDLQVNMYRAKYEYPGQLGVALSNGEFFIFSIMEHEDSDGNCEAVNMVQAFPNEFVKDNKFGKIVDVLYKGGRSTNYFSYVF